MKKLYKVTYSKTLAQISPKKIEQLYKCKCKTCYGGIKPLAKYNTDDRGYCLNCQTEEKYNLYDFVNGKAVNTQEESA